MNTHIPYREVFEREPNFRVSYEFLTESQGGRKTLPYQGIRLDFKYDGETYIIWPEFEKDNGIVSTFAPVDAQGTALMWIINPKMQPIHFKKLKIGTVGHFVEGNRIVANCTVIEIF